MTEPNRRRSELGIEESKEIILDFFANEMQHLKFTTAAHAFSDRYPDHNVPGNLVNMQIIFEGGIHSDKADRIMDAMLVVNKAILPKKV